MNERINELHEQAHSYACEYARRPDYNPHNPYNEGMYKQRHDSKFAELIVQECVDILMKPAIMEWDEGLRSELSDYNKGWVNGRLLGIEHIKEHFGVEE